MPAGRNSRQFITVTFLAAFDQSSIRAIGVGDTDEEDDIYSSTKFAKDSGEVKRDFSIIFKFTPYHRSKSRARCAPESSLRHSHHLERANSYCQCHLTDNFYATRNATVGVDSTVIGGDAGVCACLDFRFPDCRHKRISS